MQQDIDLFDDFFAAGKEESISPFLLPSSRKWAKNLRLKAALLSSILLAISYLFTYAFSAPDIAHLCLLFTFFFIGTPFFIQTCQEILDLHLNIDVLMMIAVIAAVVMHRPHEGGLLLVLFALSSALENSVKQKAKTSITSIKQILPTKATVQDRHQTYEKNIRSIPPHSMIIVQAGELIPLDGIIRSGECSVDLSHVTGEVFPLFVREGDAVVAGAKNLDGILHIETTTSNTESTLTKLVEMITEAQKSKPPLQRWIDTFSSTYTMIIILLTLLLIVLLPSLLSISVLGPHGSLYRALTFLIGASPCALILAMPIAYLSAINACAREGILLKGGYSLDALAQCKTIALDKTGTLTEGKLQCVDILGTQDSSLALHIAYGLEEHASHPIAHAIIERCTEHNIAKASLKHIKIHSGLGISGTWNAQPVRIGNLAFIQQVLDSHEIAAHVHALQERGLLYTLLLQGTHVTYFAFQDRLRQDIHSTVQTLKNYSIRMVMLTGDHEANANRVAQEVGITTYRAHLSPKDKLHAIDTLRKEAPLAMIGDGMNDAPALAKATVGIAMGMIGNAAAIVASDIILLQDHINKLPWLYSKALLTTHIVKENIIIAISSILCTSLFSILGMLPLWVAVICHEGTTLLVGLNALRLLHRTPQQ